MTGTDTAPADAAWVVVETPMAAAALSRFCRDVERLYRINPYYEFRAWRTISPDRVEVDLRNLSIKRNITAQLSIERASDLDFTVHYDRGIKRATRFEIEATPPGSRLRITDDYGDAGRDPDVDTEAVDRSLHAWGGALQDYVRREKRWSGVAPWRWYMRCVWVPMKPAARRITFIILMVALAEMVLIALVMAIYWIEYRM